MALNFRGEKCERDCYQLQQRLEFRRQSSKQLFVSKRLRESKTTTMVMLENQANSGNERKPLCSSGGRRLLASSGFAATFLQEFDP